MNQPLFSLRHINKAYRRGDEVVSIFDRMDMDVHAGDFLAVMGPSGSGKTTLLNLLGAIDRPDAGDIQFRGQSIAQLSAEQQTAWRASHVAFVFQSFNLLPMLSGFRNVELPLMLTGMSADERRARVTTALELVGLSQHAARMPAQLSGGQQQRIAIARALVADAAVMLCDEPTGNLDRRTSGEIMETLSLLNQEFGKTIVLVTHDREAARYAKRICHLDKGRFDFDAAAIAPAQPPEPCAA
ncbi:ABC transporter ATP-binding protein [Chitinimonas sp.]|uniref:ABC transporter ATP-binding protein n=1 Tax=Chitinimonas sp. TaxID=1934313 RepID=UPI0035B1C21D